MKKRIFSFVLAVLMIASLLPAAALAADFVASGTCGAEGDGSNLTWTLDSDGLLTISGTGAMKDFTSDESFMIFPETPWNQHTKDIHKVVVSDGVTTIGNCAFLACSAESILLPDSVERIGDKAFGFTSINEIIIPEGVKSIGEYVFSNCNLANVTLPNSLESIGEFAFFCCMSLQQLLIPANVSSIGMLAFEGCISLQEILVDERNAAYSSLDGVLFNAGKTEVIFCPSAKVGTYVIPDSVMSIGAYAFAHCGKLTDITFPDRLARIGDHAFSGCASLTRLTIPSGVTQIGKSAFEACGSLTGIWVTDGNSNYSSDKHGVLFNYDKTELVRCPAAISGTYEIPNGVTTLDSFAFEGCELLTGVSIPDGVVRIGESAFAYCKGLTSIAIPEGVTTIGEFMFVNCASLMEATLPDGVTEIGDHAFEYCDALERITLPDGGLTSIGEAAFNACKSLISVVIPDGVTNVACYAFHMCESLVSATIPDSVTSIDECAFGNCESLTSVTIPDSVTSIRGSAFSDCDNLTDVYYTGTEIAWNKIKISDYNDALKNATIHYFSEWTREKEPTCTEPGSETSVCPEAGCGKTFTREIPALGHSWDEGKVTKPATEAEDGVKTFTCTRCSEKKTETIPKLPHEHSYKDVVTAPTCTAKGYTTHTCACGDSYVDTYVDALGHAWDNGKVTKPATETETGTKTFTCTRCSETKTETIPKLTHEHSYKAVITAPTCTAKGYTTHTCVCGDSYVDTYVDALGHAWDNGKVTKLATETEDGVKTFTCTRCGETKAETIPATGSVNVTEMFTDVSHSWADDGIQYCVTHQLMSGVGDNLFAPKMTATRAQIVQILYNLEGEPKVSGTMPFTDLTQNWYKDAVLWAYQTGVVVGTSATTFEPDLPVTREQIAVILMEYVTKVLKLERTWTPADLSAFPDAGSVSDWAKDALADAVALGLISGASNGGQTLLEPQGSATREQVATILMEFCKNVKK